MQFSRGAHARRFGLLTASLAAAILAAVPAQATIEYTVSLAHPEQHVFHVTMTIPDVQREVTVQMPAWNALYQIRDFAYHVSAVRAVDREARALALVKLDKQTWRIAGDGTLRVQYQTYWDELGPFSTQLNSTHAFINLAMILFYVPGRRGEDVRLAFTDLPDSWRVAIELPHANAPEQRGSSAFVASSYDALVDAPAEIGNFLEFRVEGAGVPIRVAIHGEGDTAKTTREHTTETIRRITSAEIQLMRGAPFDEYLFIYHIGPTLAGAGGGMEHANSTAISVDFVGSLANVTAHEFFHLWNVKRIRPQSLEPVDYTREQWTRVLWFAEGVTSTYAAYILTRTGLWDRKDFYDDIARQIAELESRPARRWKSVEEASLDAWFEKYLFYRRPDYSISYYNKGQLLGLLLDVLIRDSTDNRASLDDVLRALNEEFGRKGRAYRDTADIRAVAEAVAGHNFEEFFSRYVTGTDELPVANYLARAGLALTERTQSVADLGFWPSRGPEGKTVVTLLEPGSAAERVGVREGDELLSINGGSVPHNTERWLRDRRMGETVRLRLRREGGEFEASFALGERQEHKYRVEETHHPTDKQRRIHEGLLRGTTDGPHP